jgi:hypothetical protein
LSELGWDDLKEEVIAKPWRPTDTDRARYALVRTYGRVIQAWRDEAGGWDELGHEIERQMREQAKNEAQLAALKACAC